MFASHRGKTVVVRAPDLRDAAGYILPGLVDGGPLETHVQNCEAAACTLRLRLELLKL